MTNYDSLKKFIAIPPAMGSALIRYSIIRQYMIEGQYQPHKDHIFNLLIVLNALVMMPEIFHNFKRNNELEELYNDISKTDNRRILALFFSTISALSVLSGHILILIHIEGHEYYLQEKAYKEESLFLLLSIVYVLYAFQEFIHSGIELIHSASHEANNKHAALFYNSNTKETWDIENIKDIAFNIFLIMGAIAEFSIFNKEIGHHLSEGKLQYLMGFIALTNSHMFLVHEGRLFSHFLDNPKKFFSLMLKDLRATSFFVSAAFIHGFSRYATLYLMVPDAPFLYLLLTSIVIGLSRLSTLLHSYEGNMEHQHPSITYEGRSLKYTALQHGRDTFYVGLFVASLYFMMFSTEKEEPNTALVVFSNIVASLMGDGAFYVISAFILNHEDIESRKAFALNLIASGLGIGIYCSLDDMENVIRITLTLIGTIISRHWLKKIFNTLINQLCQVTEQHEAQPGLQEGVELMRTDARETKRYGSIFEEKYVEERPIRQSTCEKITACLSAFFCCLPNINQTNIHYHEENVYNIHP